MCAEVLFHTDFARRPERPYFFPMVVYYDIIITRLHTPQRHHFVCCSLLRVWLQLWYSQVDRTASVACARISFWFFFFLFSYCRRTKENAVTTIRIRATIQWCVRWIMCARVDTRYYYYFVKHTCAIADIRVHARFRSVEYKETLRRMLLYYWSCARVLFLIQKILCAGK